MIFKFLHSVWMAVTESITERGRTYFDDFTLSGEEVFGTQVYRIEYRPENKKISERARGKTEIQLPSQWTHVARSLLV